MGTLLIAVLFWLFIHRGIAASPLRGVLVARLGENGYRGLFSLLSAIGLAGLIWSFGEARATANLVLWTAPTWLYWVPVVGMLPAFLLLVGSVTMPNPGMVGAEKLLAGTEPARGILRVTRHPMLCAFALWAILHIVINGDLDSLLLFAAILAVAVNGMRSIDRKRAASMPADWPRFAQATSAFPFAAILDRRNRFVWSEIGWWRLGLAVLLWLGAMYAHGQISGVPLLPG